MDEWIPTRQNGKKALCGISKKLLSNKDNWNICHVISYFVFKNDEVSKDSGYQLHKKAVRLRIEKPMKMYGGISVIGYNDYKSPQTASVPTSVVSYIP